MTLPQWQTLPVPSGPDAHPESAACAARSPDGLHLVAARVRGRKHKHEGKNCDDWFAFAFRGPWTIIAVADGAGSKPLSRVGARVACEAAVGSLSLELPVTLDGTDIHQAATCLHHAFHRAHEAVRLAAGERQLGLEDLATTLVLAVHATVPRAGSESSLVLACQVGDGIAVVVSADGKVHVLGEPDLGSYGGETEFITTPAMLTPDNLGRKTRTFLEPLQALLVMTDGVADDYYPADPEVRRLWGDLVANHVLEPPPHPGPFPQRERENGAERLRAWLDAYYVRGSFDDRTVVVLHRENRG
jgi:serine/threonine protein phosphatase PrpC